MRTIDYDNKIQKLQFENNVVNLEDCFVLAVIGKPAVSGNHQYCGLNVCVVIQEDTEFVSILNKAISDNYEQVGKNSFKVTPLRCYLLGDNDIKIPIDIAEGNSYNEGYDYGYKNRTVCYFGYVHPLLFGSTEKGRAYV